MAVFRRPTDDETTVDPGPAEASPSPAPDGGLNHLRRAWTHRRMGAKPSSDGRLALARLRQLSRDGRTVALWSLAFYVVVQVSVLLFVACCIKPPLAQLVANKKWTRLRELMASEPDRPLLMMLGSSRIEIGFDAWRMTGLMSPEGKPFAPFNFGVSQIGPLHEKLYLRELLDAGVRPRVLLVDFLPPMLNQPHRGGISEEGWIAPHWLSRRRLVRLWPYLKHPRRCAHSWLVSRLVPCYGFRHELTLLLRNTLYPWMAPGSLPDRDLRGDYLPDWVADRNKLVGLHPTDMTWPDCLGSLRVGKGPAQAMRDLVAMCRRERIPLVLVVMPEATYFRRSYRPEGLAQAKRLLDELRDQHGVPVIDANQWLADEDFIDGHHPLPKGAEQFTTRLRQEVQRLLDQGRLDCPTAR
jgi:hypothetical protein